MSGIEEQMRRCVRPRNLSSEWSFGTRRSLAEKDIKDLCAGDDSLECWMLRQLIEGLSYMHWMDAVSDYYVAYAAAMVYIARQKWGDDVASRLMSLICDQGQEVKARA
jgi:hypothetical protein